MAIQDYGRYMQSAAEFAMGPYNALMQGREYAAQEQRRNALVQNQQDKLAFDQQQAAAQQQSDAAEEAAWNQAFAAKDWGAMARIDPQATQILMLHEKQQAERTASPYQLQTQEGPFGSRIVTDGSRFQVVEPPRPTGAAAPQPQKVDVTLPDGRIQSQWVRPGESAGTPIGGPRAPGGSKPIPPAALRIVDEAKQAISATAQSDALVTNAITALEQGKVRLGVIRNTESRVRNYAGASDANSRAYASLKQTLEKLRNNYLLLAKGVQTEGDAQRAWNSEIGESVQNDNQLALQQLRKAQSMIKMQAEAQQSRIDTVYANYGAEAPPPAEQRVPRTEAPPAAIEYLRAHPESKAAFFKKYGYLP